MLVALMDRLLLSPLVKQMNRKKSRRVNWLMQTLHPNQRSRTGYIIERVAVGMNKFSVYRTEPKAFQKQNVGNGYGSYQLW